MSSTLSVGELGCTRAPRYPLAPMFVPGSVLKTFAPTAMSSRFDISFTTQPMTSLDQTDMRDLIAASSTVSKTCFRSPSVIER